MVSLTDDAMSDFKPRAYQVELYEYAKKQNSVLVLGTGSGKTFISILLIKDLGHQIRKSQKENRKWTVFVVNTVPLVYQQGHAIKQHTPYTVGMYEGSLGVDLWSHEKWQEELQEHEVIVIVDKILEDMLNHSYLSLENINLLIFDECHHAIGKHPMKEIMSKFTSFKGKKCDASLPRIVGLTACAIHRRCKFGDVEKELRDLETTLHSTLVTSVDVQEVIKHTTAPKEIIVLFNDSKPTEYAENVGRQLKRIEDELDGMDIDENYKKPQAKKLVNIVKIIHHLGDWFGAQAIKYEMENFEESDDFEDIPAVRNLKKLLCQRLNLVYDFCREVEEQIDNPVNHITEKVQRLLDILQGCGNDKYVLIFVETRNTAKLLYEFFLKISLVNENLAFIKPAYIIGANSRIFDINLLQNELRKQKKTLAAFARGDTNILISTSILEEGVDVRKCNLVIRFDKPPTYRSYVQSRGRARAIPSFYVLMVDTVKRNEFLSDIAEYRKIESVLSKVCHNRQLPTNEEIRAHFEEDEIVAPYEPYPPDGPRVTFNSAVSLVNVYCGKLPQDKFTELTPTVTYETKDEDGRKKYKAEIQLPINACLRVPISGDWMNYRMDAKKSAALALCKKLHEMNELNEYLRPEGKSGDSILEDLVVLPPEVPNQAGMPEPGTKKRRQIYKKEMCQALSSINDSFKLYAVNVQPIGSNEIGIGSERNNLSVGLLCKQDLRSPLFSLYSSKWNEVLVEIQLINECLVLDSEVISHIKHFHKVVFENLLDISKCLFDYFPQQTSLFILPMNRMKIDISLLKHISSLDSLRNHDEKKSHGDIFTFERSVFEDSIIYPLYRSISERMFYVSEIHDKMTPLDPFPTKDFDSYESYFLSEYGRRITNRAQPLITAKHLPKELNYLKKSIKKKSKQDPPKYVPELCGVFPLKASLWWQIMLLPSVLHRLNGLLVADELRNMITPDFSLCNWQCTEYKFDCNWSRKLIERILQPHGSNLSVILASSKSEKILSYMILNAITLVGANESFDGERLEVLGDSFLKFITAEHLYLKFLHDHEGKLSERRSKLVCNRTLYSLGRVKQIPEKIQGTILCPTTNGIMPGFVLKTKVEQKLREIRTPHDFWARFGETTEEEFKEEMRNRHVDGKLKTCYNPWTEHELGDKSVADCVEALLGVFLLVGGNTAAITFLHNLGIGVVNGTSLLKTDLPIKSALLKDETEARREVQRYYERSCLDDLEKKIKYTFNDKSFLVQAVTHSSFCQNKVTDCYQRLEFLGDAVLDYLVTGMIFSSNKNYSPGELSDLRSYYVKNETLAKVSVKLNLHHHLLHLSPKLQASIDKYLSLFLDGLDDDEELYTEDDEVILQEVEVPKALGDLVEAIIGAVYLDSGRSLQKAWNVVTNLMGDIIKEMPTEIPLNPIRKLYEKVPTGLSFTKLVVDEEDNISKYELKIKDLPPILGLGKSYKVAKIAAAKKGLRMLKEKERKAGTSVP